MELKVFLSGVPMGENLWGDLNDNSYFGTLYVPSKENHKFDIRLGKSTDKIYAYYHYLVYNTINDYEGRTGSYFGLTVRLDSYCIDYQTIYDILDVVYRKKICGFLLKEANGGRLQYTVPVFEKKTNEIQEIEKFIRTTLGTTLNSSDFRNIPTMPTGKVFSKLHFEDATIKSVMQSVGQSASCSLSFDYDSQKTISVSKDAFIKGEESKQKEIFDLKNRVEELEKNEQELLEEANKQVFSVQAFPKPNNVKDYEETFSSKNTNNIWALLGKVLLIIDIIAVGFWFYFNYVDKTPIIDAQVSEHHQPEIQNEDDAILRLFEQQEEYDKLQLKPTGESSDTITYQLIGSNPMNFSGKVIGTNCKIDHFGSTIKVIILDKNKECKIVYTDDNQTKNYKSFIINKKE